MIYGSIFGHNSEYLTTYITHFTLLNQILTILWYFKNTFYKWLKH